MKNVHTPCLAYAPFFYPYDAQLAYVQEKDGKREGREEDEGEGCHTITILVQLHLLEQIR